METNCEANRTDTRVRSEPVNHLLVPPPPPRLLGSYSMQSKHRAIPSFGIFYTLPIQKGSLPEPAMPRCGVLRRAVPRCGTVCRAILSRVAWLVVSFLYSFVGKSAASLVFKRRQRER
ncbi:hypothetical protein ALC53_03679 [Atta colombica]|uniref:Uncharacterized protein n=1 Tax=Atta colombica TaxID=520822 RepID=A0A195BNY0_9HYME|nr:hypothetical protein ALC53_03679 [Atta colombica]